MNVNVHHAKPGVMLTDAAKQHIMVYLEKKSSSLGVRFSVKKTGCSGLSYVVEYVDFLPQDDLAFPLSQAYQVFVDKPSYPVLQGVTVDCVKDQFGSKLIFQNPNKKGECGCGESFIV